MIETHIHTECSQCKDPIARVTIRFDVDLVSLVQIPPPVCVRCVSEKIAVGPQPERTYDRLETSGYLQVVE